MMSIQKTKNFNKLHSKLITKFFITFSVNIFICLFAFINVSKADKIFIPMDLSQKDHLKAYGVAFYALKQNMVVDWLLNYKNGSFMLDDNGEIATECRIRGVTFDKISEGSAQSIIAEIKKEEANMDVMKLEKAPKIAVYVTPGNQPWDDAVRLVLEYAEIEHDLVWDEEVINGKLKNYDWIHLHHEDFTGQYGKFWLNYRNETWYQQLKLTNEAMAQKLGFDKVSEMKKAVALKLRSFIAEGGFLFAMCSATDSYDIAISAINTDICDTPFDNDPIDYNYKSKLDFSETLAFENFSIIHDSYIYEFSDIDTGFEKAFQPGSDANDYFTLFDFSAKYDPVPTMLTQNHVNIVKGFLGQTTAFKKEFIKKSVLILGMKEGTDEVKYIHGNVGRGFFTWYGGHDPEDYRHAVGDAPTVVSLYKQSPGYRLILNNILFPAAKKKKQKT